MKTTLETIYSDFHAHEKNAQALLKQTDWFCRIADFDPKTGLALPQALSSVLAKIASPITGKQIHDRLWRIADHSRASVERLFRSLNESPRREQALMPVHAVRELDASSFIKLSNRPGRTIREKLAGKPYLQAVRRFQSVNLPENRLLKAFVTRLAELLELRQACLGQAEDELLPQIHSWLRSDEANSISQWDNLPPNNTLLSHRDYRRVWDAWRWLQSLDEDINDDFKNLKSRGATMLLWNEYAKMWANGSHLFVDMPVFFDYENFEVRPWLSQVNSLKVTYKITRKISTEKILTPVCVDLSVLRPRYATKAISQSLCESYLWQQWSNNDESVEIELYNSDAVYLNPDARTISSSDLFFSKDNASECFDRAARAFASRLHNVFKNDTLIWLFPDFLNDFEIEAVRRNLNARFPGAEPLPRSVAAAFEQIDYSKISEGFRIVVVDTIGGKTCITKLQARVDPELNKRLPETSGYYWERCPPLIIEGKAPESPEVINYDVITFDSKGQWHDVSRAAKRQVVDLAALKRNPRIGQFEVCINLSESPVGGGSHLHALQQRAGDIPLWRDHIPELSIKVMKNGIRHRFHLVSRGTTVKPIRGKPVPIPIDEYFTLPAGKPYYSFPLFIGDNADNLGFSARLDSSAFPLKNNVVCKLNLTFEYGADDPYKLIFAPCDGSFPPIRTTWLPTEEIIFTDAPSPEYPTPKTWAELRIMPKLNSSETNDLLDWVLKAIKRLDSDLFIHPKPSKPRTTGKITSYWHEKNGKHFNFVQCNDTDNSVLIHETRFARGFSYENFKEGDEISFELQEKDGRYSGTNIAIADYSEPLQTTRLKELSEGEVRNVIENIHKRLYFPIIQVWRDGRSIKNDDCSPNFRDDMMANLDYLVGLLQNDGIPKPVRQEVEFLLACMHKDVPNECAKQITERFNSNGYNNLQKTGFALGDMTMQWQKDAFAKLMTQLHSNALPVFAYAIWRESFFIEKFNLTELQSILQHLTAILSAKLDELGQYQLLKDEKIKLTMRNWVRAAIPLLELLLGLLRTRASSDPEIKMLLQPHQKITKELAKQVERITEIVAKSNAQFFSRVQINVQKPEGDRTPDLLFALRLYLTGDDGANAIHITSVSDSDNE